MTRQARWHVLCLAGVGMSDSSAATGAVGGSVMLQGPLAENVWLPGHLLD